VRLDESINDLVMMKEPSRKTLKNREDLFARLEMLVEENFQDYGTVRLFLFGSCAVNLDSDTSDLDMCIAPMDDKENGLKDYQRLDVLQNLYRCLQEREFGEIDIIYSARVPVCKLTDASTGIQCDFILPVGNLEKKTEILRVLGRMDQRFRPFILTVKHWSKSRGIGEAARGALNSFGHTLLAVHFLQAVEPPVLPIIQVVDGEIVGDEHESFVSENTSTLGELLAGYFEYYSHNFDRSIHCVSILDKDLEECSGPDREAKFPGRQQRYLCVVDPVDCSDNVGRNIPLDGAKAICLEFERGWNLIQSGATLDDICQVPAIVPDFRVVTRY